MTFNLAEETKNTKAQEEGLRIELITPSTANPAGSWVVVAGLESRRALAARRDAWRRTMDGRTTDPTAEDVKTASSWTLAGSVIEWGGFTIDGKEDLPLTVENAMMVFTQVPWVEDAIEIRVRNRANFTKS